MNDGRDHPGRRQFCAFTGVVAGFWHIFWIAGVAVLATGLLGVTVHSAGYARLEQDQQPTSQPSEEPGDAESWALRRGVVPADQLASSVAQTTRFG